MVTIKTIEDKVPDKSAIKDIDKAYKYALKEHKGMKRLTNDDFITHPLEVANILADLNVDPITIEAALLHETINNGNSTKEILEKEFGSEIATIVDSVSKINKLELPDNSESSKIYLRKILIGMSEDVRVLYIKLADRLHNMRTNWAVNPNKQKQKARETMDVLIPIAHRLGMYSIKSELENLCLYYLKPDVYNDILEKLNATVDELNDSLENMKQSLIDLLTENNIKFEIKGRVKSVYSIYNKLSNGKSWNEIYDILALRIFTNEISDCYTIVGLIHSKFRPVPNRFKDYIAQPKENLYQSLHTTIFGEDGKVFEIQIRTYEMDEIDEKGLASHWSYKEKGAQKIQNVMAQKLEMYRNIIENGTNSEDDMSLEKEIVSDLIYVYTPKGDVVELPKGSTPIDFAYRIHSKVGDTTVGSIVNDNIVPFSYELKDGDIVKIKTNSNGTPNKDWLTFVKTSQAASKIKSYFSKKDHEEYVLKGKNILEKELRKRKIAYNEVFSQDSLNKIIKDLKLKDEDDLYLSLGTFRYTAGYIINLTDNDKREVPDALIDKKKNDYKVNYKDDIFVDGEVNILINLAKCCKPVKGDDIVGYITKGQGITVHKRNCPNIRDIKERLIEVTWNENSKNEYLSDVYIYCNSDHNILQNIIEIGTKKSIYIQSFNTVNNDNDIIYELTIKIKDKKQLDEVISAFLNIPYVKNVTKMLEIK
jgi:guanosine-3',5'-bis(diphosphate) 3'-pyrophosphohydrolase